MSGILEDSRHGARVILAQPGLKGEGYAIDSAPSPAMQRVSQVIARVGPSDANVLVTGEHGSGRAVVARALHGVSPRPTTGH